MTNKARECAFCPTIANLSAEHITSKWMSKVFPTLKSFKTTDHLGNVRQFKARGLQLKANVVCTACNNNWMSDIENLHAKPVMEPMMRGNPSAAFGSNEARSLAIFAFKTAVVIDHDQAIKQSRESFFSRRQRYAFRKHLIIPQNVNMWLAPYIPHPRLRRFDIRVAHVDGMELLPGYRLSLYTFSWGIGSLAFQVLAHKQTQWVDFRPKVSDFDNLAVPFWPPSSLPIGYAWPGYRYIKSREEFEAFARRWREVVPMPPLDTFTLQ